MRVLVDIDQSLKSEFLDDADLQRLRSENDPIATNMISLVAKLTPLLQASQKRLDALTPKPNGGDITPEGRAELTAEKAKFDALDANIRSARALIVDANDISARIAERRRALFARQTFAQSQSLLSPTLWSGAAADAPRAFAVLSGLLGRLDVAPHSGAKLPSCSPCCWRWAAWACRRCTPRAT